MKHTTMKYILAALCTAAGASMPSLAADKYWVGGASGNWSDASWADTAGGAGGAWVDGSTAIFSGGSVTIGGSTTQNVARIENAGTGTVTLNCPVKFSGTYYVVQNGPVYFTGGATATYPDDALRTTTATANTLALRGDFTFTADWTVPSIGNTDAYPWIVSSGSTVRGKKLVGANSNTALILRIDQGGSAYFDSMAIGSGKGEISVDGYLEVAGNIELASGCSLGRDGNIGTVKANGFIKVSGSSTVSCRVPNLIVGAGGLGVTYKDYYWQFSQDTTITATADFNFLGMYRSGNTHDWGIHLGGQRITVNVPAGITVTCGIGIAEGDGVIYKTGAGTLVMTDTYNGQSGYVKKYTGGTIINEGTVRLAANGQLGTGLVMIADGARLEVASGVSVSNQLIGEGSVYFENGVSLAVNSASPCLVGEVELASGASVSVTASDSPTAPAALLTGVASADYGRFSIPSGFSFVGGAIVKNNAAAATDYVWAGASGADWATPASWLVDGATPAAAPTSADTIRFENDESVAVGGSGTLTVAKVVTTTGAQVTFTCPVAFAGTYLVENTAVAPRFAAGATATYPDASLTGMNTASHALKGSITLTEDWTIPAQTAGRPFVLTEGSTLTGKVLSGTSYTAGSPALRIDKNAVATFDSVAVAGKLGLWFNGGRLVSTGDITVGGEGSPRDFGYYNKINPGTVEANGFYKNVDGYGAINLYVTNFVVGAGGFGMQHKDYNFVLCKNVKLTAKDDLTIYQPCDGTSDSDWGIEFGKFTFTVDTAGHDVAFESLTRNTVGHLVKDGGGELVMRGRLKLHTGGTTVNAGTLKVDMVNGTGRGLTTVNSGATIAFTANATVNDYPLTLNAGATLTSAASVAESSTLTLGAGVTIKSVQNTYFDASSGALVLPATGTVTIDMRDFDFVNGVPNPVLGGVAAGDEAKFSALVPEGIVGSFSVSGGILSYTVTSGGSAAADLLWHPQGDSTWSTGVAAWTNAAGEQVAFTPYANVTVADAATISLPADVAANDVAITADGDVALNGAGKLGGPGTIVKTGEGIFTFNAAGGLDAQPIIVSNGVFKLGDNLGTRALGAPSDVSPVIVENGATLDINYSSNAASDPHYDPVRSSLTHDKLIKIAGDGVDGKGAIISTNQQCYLAFSDVELTDDATIGGTVRSDFRHSTSYGLARGTTRNTLTGPGKCLTVKNSAMLALVGTTVNLGSILVPDGSQLRIEQTSTWNLPGGIRLAGGKLSFYGSDSNPGTVPLVAESGTNTITGSSNTWRGPVTVAEGATLIHASDTTTYKGEISGTMTVSGGTANYEGVINGALDFTGGTMNMAGGIPANGWTLNSPKTAGTVHIRQSGTYTGADVTAYALGVADQANTTVDVTFNDSTLDIANLYMGWGGGNGALAPSGYLSIGPGTTLTAGKICVGDDGTSTSNNIKSVMSVDGGNVRLTGTLFYIAYNGPHSDFVVNSGTMTVDQAQIRLRANGQVWGGGNTARFIQNGGVFNYGGTGFITASNIEDNNDGGQVIFSGGEMNATANWSIPPYASLYFRDGVAGGWTLNQADGTTATLKTALHGGADVTLNGAATLVGDKEVQGAAGGKWTVGGGFTADLRGAASLLGGLDIGEGASVTVDVATNRCAVFTARDFSSEPTEATCITNRFNRMTGSTTRGTITHDETFLFKYYAQADRPFGNMSYSAAYAVGQFYVEDGKAGEWTFKGKCDDWVLLWIDGELVMASSKRCAEANGTKNLSVGWHSFRHVATDNGGGFGASNGNAYETIGYKDGSGTMSSFARFNVENLKMRPGADFGDPNNANTVRWSHYKQPDSTDWRNGEYKQDELPWDFCCITNNLQKLQWYGGTDTTWFNVHTVNRYDGWFYVTAENADKEWTFRTQYDDRCALWIDGVDSGLKGESGNSQTYKVTLSRGWHKFEIRTYDNTGNAGPWGGNGFAVSYQVADGPETLFSEQTLALSVCPDGYIQGDVKLASGATLSNGASGEALVYGNMTATGTGATVNGKFRFEGGTLAFQSVDPAANDLATMLAFSNPSADYLADIGAITVDFTAKPTRSKVTVCPAGGLTAETAAQKVRVTVNGEPVDHVQCVVEGGNLKVRLACGTVIYVR